MRSLIIGIASIEGLLLRTVISSRAATVMRIVSGLSQDARYSRHPWVYPRVAMERARATWTDERLDDLSRRVDDGFRRVDQDLRELRSEMNAGFDALSVRFDTLHRLIVQVSGAMIIAVIATLVSVLATRV
jgi:hypothetical protein